ncbi:24792_t:CDS:1, partial [Gigaspora rosea]
GVIVGVVVGCRVVNLSLLVLCCPSPLLDVGFAPFCSVASSFVEISTAFH